MMGGESLLHRLRCGMGVELCRCCSWCGEGAEVWVCVASREAEGLHASRWGGGLEINPAHSLLASGKSNAQFF